MGILFTKVVYGQNKCVLLLINVLFKIRQFSINNNIEREVVVVEYLKMYY